MSSDSYYKWRSQCAGMDASHMKQLRKLTSENARLKKLYAEPLLHTDIIKEALAKSNRANTQIAVQLRQIISLEHQKRRGFKLCFDHMRSVLGLKYNHKRVCRIYCQEKPTYVLQGISASFVQQRRLWQPPLQSMRYSQLTSCTTS
jgi:hypothetical protein